MTLPITAYYTPPPYRTPPDDHPTLLAAYWCSGICIIAFVFRIMGRYIRIEKLYSDDIWMAITILPLCWRLGFIHVVLKKGTGNVAGVENISESELKDREWGTGMVLGARVGLACYIWMQKFSITVFYSRLTSNLIATRKYRLGLFYLRIILLVTFLITFLTIFIPCAPSSYTTVYPRPSDFCRTSFLPVITSAILSSICDILLSLAPIPTILRSSLPWFRKARLIISFGLSFGTVVVSAYKAYAIVVANGSQQTRTVWASIEIIAATFVANAIVLNSFFRGQGEQKTKYRYPDPDERDMIRERKREERQRALKKSDGLGWMIEEDEEEMGEWKGPSDSNREGRGGLDDRFAHGRDLEASGKVMGGRRERPVSGESRWEMLTAAREEGEARGGGRESLSSTNTAHHHGTHREDKEQRPMSALSVEGAGCGLHGSRGDGVSEAVSHSLVAPPLPAVLRDNTGFSVTAKG